MCNLSQYIVETSHFLRVTIYIYLFFVTKQPIVDPMMCSSTALFNSRCFIILAAKELEEN